MTRRDWAEPVVGIAVSRQGQLVGVARSTIYAGHRTPVVSEDDLLICRLIDAEYTEHPFYGTRRMVVILRRLGHEVNRKRVQRLMRTMGLAGMAPGPHTSRPHPQHKIYPYLLRGLAITRPNQVVGYGCDLHPAGTGVCLSGGHHGLVLSQGAVVADQQHDGC